MNTNTALVMIIACSDSLDHVLDHLVHEHLAAAIGAGARRHAYLGTRKFTQPAQAGSQHLAVPDNAAASLIEVTNAVPHASHDQAWSMRPRRLNRDSSAISRTLPQSGHFGRLRTSVARTRVDALWHADCPTIVDASSMLAHRTQPIARHVEDSVWRRRDAFMKLPWLWKVPE
jgi:hypothetical protein